MNRSIPQSLFRLWRKLALTTFILGLTMLGTSAWAGPYLHVTTEYSKARSQGECQSFAAKAVYSVAKSSPMKVDQKNNRLGWTSATTIYVDCIFVGKNAQKRNQWIYYISAASTNLKDSEQLRKRLQSTLRKIAPID